MTSSMAWRILFRGIIPFWSESKYAAKFEIYWTVSILDLFPLWSALLILSLKVRIYTVLIFCSFLVMKPLKWSNKISLLFPPTCIFMNSINMLRIDYLAPSTFTLSLRFLAFFISSEIYFGLSYRSSRFAAKLWASVWFAFSNSADWCFVRANS